jgi:hypothetical protein
MVMQGLDTFAMKGFILLVSKARFIQLVRLVCGSL